MQNGHWIRVAGPPLLFEAVRTVGMVSLLDAAKGGASAAKRGEYRKQQGHVETQMAAKSAR